MFNIYLGIYIIFAMYVLIYGPYKFMDKPITAFVFFIFSLILFIIFGIKWFDPKGPFSKTPVSWPPTINTCPDYLIYYSRKLPTGATQDTCIDTIGVSKNGTLAVYPKTGTPEDNKYYFQLATKNSNPAGKNSELCQRAVAFGLTWEGITNGESCISPDGSVSGGAPSGASNRCD
jgi:hypothetical protein